MPAEDSASSEGRAPLQEKRKRVASDETTASARRPPNKRARLAADLSLSQPDDRRALEAVESKYDVQVHSIVSSTKIQTKVISALRHLSESAPADADLVSGKQRIVVLKGAAAVAGKLVSIAEIAKREVAAHENGAWFQYIALGQEIKETHREKPVIVEETILDGRNKSNNHEPEEDEEDDFEYMKTPFERALEGKPKKHAVAIMSLFLSRASVEELKRRFSEQSGTSSTQIKT
ncbi:hypothetical protein PFICI_13130 [Pestalotiopsis fici W106-1]|uniref:DNA/RNA-binding protein Alba-like domain-containing protein n=1 Tax=Pestalotiopsis fici (strain W106-1 / CGMCC3.15140) TaxID=1229662 RepID=W3WPA8_PESFW|nr:uncharacterized protein PFICI_13130 [Pestalotiopsis fici W106-1]ETS74646.1 hypothetical protein PFICI_13130 [Pestalotiopsis fici W106-1]